MDEWNQDDPITAEINQTVDRKFQEAQDRQYRLHLAAEAQRRAEETYFSRFPHQRHVRGTVMEVAGERYQELIRENPQYAQTGLPQDKIDAELLGISQRVDQRLARATTPGATGPGYGEGTAGEALSRFERGEASNEAVREEALRESQERYQRARQPLSRPKEK